jgi:hypothetical protein
MQKSTEIKEQVIVVSVAWVSDSKHIGKVVTLKHRATEATWATGTLPDGDIVLMQRYMPATELNKALV